MGRGGTASHPQPPGEGGGGDDPFQVGFAISVWQSSGDQHQDASNWGIFERQRALFGLMPTIAHNARIKQSCDFWNRYEEDLERARQMGSNCFRLSLEWHRIEPEQGRINLEAIQRYHDIFDCMESKGMEAHVTLHHFVHPAWFEKLGGFLKEENTSYFLDYTQTAFRHFGKRAKYWATFNEPGVMSFAGHVYGSFPPGRMGHVAGCARHLLNMLRAHGKAYDVIKAMPGGQESQVGIVWNYFWFEPKTSSWTPPYVAWLSRFLTRLWGNDMFMHYMMTGDYDWNPLPWIFTRVHTQDKTGPPGCDFLGLNYYSRGVIDWKLQPTCNAGEVMTDMPYALYPEGLVVAVHHMCKLGVPVYITETGVADINDDRRPQMINSYMAEVERAVQLGYDLRGIMYWTLIDNFEWGFGWTTRFGMYRWEDDGTQKRIPRPSIAVLKGWFARLPGRVAELMKERKKKGEKASGDVDVEEVEEEVGEEAMELAGVSK